MHKKQFIQNIQEQLSLPDAEITEEAARIVLSLFSHRLQPAEAKDVKAQLPPDLKKLWTSDTWITNYLALSGKHQLKYRHKAEFLSLVESELKKTQIHVGAEKLVKSVFNLLKEQITSGETQDVASQLPPEIKELWLAA